ncbi:M43 family zinc metalloprotease [Aquimarina sp. 2201CG1-2-11]|uniref:M43 family zinc metalloprotease n=1 Tax=Aquimarina discodermiae TaxID=3231043 RepID=UPI0034637E5C
MKLKVFIIGILLCGYIPFIYSQERPSSCFQQKTMEEYYQKNPQAKFEQDAFNKYAAAYAKREVANKLAATTIPVVVHVFGKVQSGRTLTYEKIRRAIEVVNEDFNGRNPDFNTVDPFFRNRRSTLDIEFKLAKIDPNGGATSGVQFYDDEQSGFGEGGTHDGTIAHYAWDNNKYMNVYILAILKDNGATNSSGVAWLPNTAMNNAGTARVVYNGQYLHGNTDNEFASIFTHEFGHWLNLYHTFNGNGCNDLNGDFVNDTPTEDTSPTNQGCRVGASECGNLINYENYMGYESSLGCAKMFTRGQVTRMSAALNQPSRRTIWQSGNLTATGVNLNRASLVIEGRRHARESNINNGSIKDANYIVNIIDGTFALSNGKMNQGTHFNASLPQGITADITVENNRRLRVRFNGRAVNHSSANNRSGSITFTNAAISGGSSRLNVNKIAFDFLFYDSFTVVYENITDLTATTGDVFKFFRVRDNKESEFGLFYNASNAQYQLETYRKSLVCQSGTRNIVPIQANQLISDNSNWVKGLVYPNAHAFSSSNYTAWNGRTAYVGFQFELHPGEVNYGWFRVRFTGSALTILDYAYSTRPNGPIRAGSRTLDPVDPTCNDGIQNGNETGIDCGGDCPPCEVDPTCNDGIQNGNETGIDCGGDCPPCEVDPTCNDGIQNGDETGIDCGGSSCPPCTNITYCTAGNQGVNYIASVTFGSISNTSQNSSYSDFTSQSTTVEKGASITLTVTPGIATSNWSSNVVGGWIDWNQDGNFDGVNEQVLMKPRGVGGGIATVVVPNTARDGRTRLRVRYRWFSNPAPCGATEGDEVEDYTVVVGGGTTPTCNDGIQNGNETGIDCGGDCPPCEVDPTCNDGIQNGDETGIDCGGSSCPPCDIDVTYCTAGIRGVNYIASVNFGSISNTSQNSSYTDYTSLSTNVTRGEAIALTVTPGIVSSNWNGNAIGSWIDWNRNGSFDDAGEQVLLKPRGTGGGSATVVVPSNAQFGATRLRVRYDWWTNPDPCGNQGDEVEDYTVNVVANKSGNIDRNNFVSVANNPLIENVLNLNFNNANSGKVVITVYSINGTRIANFTKEMNAAYTLSLQLNNNRTGLYFARITTQDRSNTVRFMIK